MPQDPQQYYTIPNMNGGLNTYADPTLIADNETPACQNMDFDLPGKATQRSGYERVGNSLGATRPWGRARYYIQATNQDYLVVKVATTFYYLLSTATTTWTAIAGVYTASNTSFAVYNDKLYAFNRTDGLIEWTGTGAFTAYALAPKGDIGCIAQNKGFTAGVTGANLSRLYYSVTGTVTDYAGAGSGFIDINKNDNSQITSVAETGGRVLVHKGDGGIYEVDYDDTGVPFVTKLPAEKGAVNHDVVSVFNNDGIYLASDSIRTVGQFQYFPESQRDGELSLKIRPDVKAFQSTRIALASGNYIENKYYLAVPVNSSTYNDTVYTFAYGAWSMYQNVYAFGFVLWNGYVHFFDSRTSQLYRFNPSVKTDDGVAITSTLRTKIFSITTEAGIKQILGWNGRMRADAGTSISMSYSGNLGDFGGSMTASPVDQSQTSGTPAPAFGRRLGVFGRSSLPFTSSSLQQTNSIFMSFRTSFNTHVTYIQGQFNHNAIGKSWELLSYDWVYSDDGQKSWYDINTNVAYQ